MIFNTAAYYLLFLLPAAICFRLSSASVRPFLLAAFGAAFFIYFAHTLNAHRFAAACVLIFFWEAWFSRLYRERSIFCLIGVVQSVVILSVFKYYNFFVDLTHVGKRWPQAFLPLGISFFTFEFIHYAVDRYRGVIKEGRFRDYLAFIFFFPSMVAGPIKRYQEFVPHLEHPSEDWFTDLNRGATRILAGLVKKFALADLLTALTGHLVRADIATANRLTLLFWVFAYGQQIYFDFSAYSDIAIGSARLFGIKLPENFDWPYLQRNISDFWRHWHISLSRWLTDYVFIPLGGSRRKPARVIANLLITMLVSGIWHGAGLNFIAWGLWHGILLIAHRLWRQRFPERSISPTISWALTFFLVNLGWAFFSMDLSTARFFFARLLT